MSEAHLNIGEYVQYKQRWLSYQPQFQIEICVRSTVTRKCHSDKNLENTKFIDTHMY